MNAFVAAIFALSMNGQPVIVLVPSLFGSYEACAAVLPGLRQKLEEDTSVKTYFVQCTPFKLGKSV